MTVTLPTKVLLTADDFWHSPDNDMRRELVAGEVIETMPPGALHGTIAYKVAHKLGLWVDQGAGGCIGLGSGFVLARDLDTVRAPDVFYLRAERVPATGLPEGFWQLAPDLAVEVVSPSESAQEVRGKVRDYLGAGTALVWVVYPRSQEVVVHTPDGRAQTFGADDTLAGFELLPGFSCAVSSLFE